MALNARCSLPYCWAHFAPDLGIEGKPEPGLCFETCLSHFHIRVTQQDLFWPCLYPDVELCHWLCQSLHTMSYPSLSLTSSYPNKNPPPYDPNLYKQEDDA